MYIIISSFYGQISTAKTMEEAQRKVESLEAKHSYSGETFTIHKQ